MSNYKSDLWREPHLREKVDFPGLVLQIVKNEIRTDSTESMLEWNCGQTSISKVVPGDTLIIPLRAPEISKSLSHSRLLL